mgnify:CR=1 FL=1|jgi:tetratricopeptide (TPR) repeat protein
MYLKGSKFRMTGHRWRVNPLRVVLLAAIVAVLAYVNQFVTPVIPAAFAPTPSPTSSPLLYANQAKQLESSGKFYQAIQAYQQASALDPKNMAYYLAMARLQIYSGDYKSAVTNAENALVINANSSEAYALKGWALGFEPSYLDAEAALNKAIELDGNDSAAYAYLAEVLIGEYQSGMGTLGILDRAIQASRTAQTLAPNSMEAHRARGVVLEATGNNQDAITEFQAAIDANKNVADLHIMLGRNYRALGSYDKAYTEFNTASTLMPDSPVPLTYLARTYFMAGEYVKAIQYAQNAIKLSPSDPYLYGNLGTMYYRNAQLDEAIQVLKLAVQGGTAQDGTAVTGLKLDYYPVSEYYYTYGLALAKQSRCTEAMPIAQALQQSVAANEPVTADNAQQIIALCTGGPTPQPTTAK